VREELSRLVAASDPGSQLQGGCDSSVAEWIAKRAMRAPCLIVQWQANHA